MRRVGCRGALSVLVALTAAAMLLASCGGTPTASDQRQTPRSRLPKMAGAADPPSCSDAPQGKVVSTSFTSEATGGIEHLRIYTPPGFEPATTASMPLLVLLHGATDDETQWIDVGVAGAADCLIGSGEIKPMVIVAADRGRAENFPSTAGDQAGRVASISRSRRRGDDLARCSPPSQLEQTCRGLPSLLCGRRVMFRWPVNSRPAFPPR